MENSVEKPKIPWSFFVIAFVITWIIWSPGILSSLGWINLPIPFMVFFFIGTWGPFFAALIMISREGGSNAVKKFLKRGIQFKIPILWLVIIFLLPLLVSAVPLGLHILFGGVPPRETILFQPWMILPVYLTYFFTGGGNEEWGWRGYALDRLQERWNPLLASLILSVFWGLWHLPLFFIEGTGQYHMSFMVFLLVTPGMSILHTWIYNKTGKNLFAVWLFHAALGTAWEIFPIVQPMMTGYESVYIFDFAAVTIFAVIVLLMEGVNLGHPVSVHQKI